MRSKFTKHLLMLVFSGVLIVTLPTSALSADNKVTYSLDESSVTENNTDSVPDPATLKKQVFDAVNARRKSLGLPEYIWHDALAVSANKRSMELALKFSHSRPDNSYFNTSYDNVEYTYIGENIGYGHVNGVDIYNMWMASPKHKALIEDKIFSHTAIGVYIAEDGTAYFVEEFLR